MFACQMLMVLTTKTAKPIYHLPKSMPKAWKACLLQSDFANRTGMPKLAARCPILQKSNFLLFLKLPRYVISCAYRLFCYSSNQKLRYLLWNHYYKKLNLTFLKIFKYPRISGNLKGKCKSKLLEHAWLRIY